MKTLYRTGSFVNDQQNGVAFLFIAAKSSAFDIVSLERKFLVHAKIHRGFKYYVQSFLCTFLILKTKEN